MALSTSCEKPRWSSRRHLQLTPNVKLYGFCKLQLYCKLLTNTAPKDWKIEGSYFSWCFQTFEPPLPLDFPPYAKPPIAHKSHPGDTGPWTLNRLELSSCWQMHRYYVYNKYFITKLTTSSLYEKSLISTNIVNKTKRVY